MKDVKHERPDDDDRENGANGEDRKGASVDLKNPMVLAHRPSVSMDSPVPAHDDLDTAE